MQSKSTESDSPMLFPLETSKKSIREGLWPTPSAEDHKTDGPKVIKRLFTKEMKTCDQRLRNFAGMGGQLNPTWVEWLMGYPFGWTGLNASVMPLSLKSQKSYSEG